MIQSAISTIHNFISSTHESKHGFESLNNQEILKIMNTLSSIFPTSFGEMSMNLPKIVCVGSQSAGKSSLLCGLIGMNILPTGKEMVTRCPLNLQLLTHSKQEAWAEFNNNNKKIRLSLPDPTSEEIRTIKTTIEHLTNKMAGNNKNISKQEIILKIYSPNVPNLSLVDLPGITLIPCIDQGQPQDIKQQIRDLISHYIRDSNTIILAVMQAREDLETDMALELVKEFDPNGSRTCGILTKIDLMNKDNTIQQYLMNNNISSNLRLGYGYYAINNFPNESMHQSLKEEAEYFHKHPIYGSLSCGNKLGRICVGIQLSNILINIIKTNIPRINEEIRMNEKRIVEESHKLGLSLIQKSDSEKCTYTHLYLSNFCTEYIKAIHEKGGLNYGKYLKQRFVNFRTDVRKLKYQYEEEYIQNMVQNCNGNHMDVSIFSIDVLEHCLQDPSQYVHVFEPFSSLSNDLLINIRTVLISLIQKILERSELMRFVKLRSFIQTESSVLLTNMCLDNNQRILDLIETEKTYIWTDHVQFNQDLKNMINNNKNTSQTSMINQLINTYMNTVKETVSDQVPKIIMCFLVESFMKKLYSHLFESIGTYNINELLQEGTDIEQKRIIYSQQLEKIQHAKKTLKF